MSRADNTRYLIQAAAARRQNARHKASQAIERLDQQGEPITFAAIAAAAGVSRTWLYRQDDLRELIGRLRANHNRPVRTPITQRASDASLRQRLDTARDEMIARLPAAENADLRQRTRTTNSANSEPTHHRSDLMHDIAYRTLKVYWIDPSPLGLVGNRWADEHRCSPCRRGRAHRSALLANTQAHAATAAPKVLRRRSMSPKQTPRAASPFPGTTEITAH